MEYDSNEFIKLYNSYGIIHEKPTLYFLEMNGNVERKNRTYFELVVTILLNLGVVSHWWGKVLLIVCYVLNRAPNSKTKISHYEIWKNKKPNVSYFRKWGFGLCM